jgi:hypothetical protein
MVSRKCLNKCLLARKLIATGSGTGKHSDDGIQATRDNNVRSVLQNIKKLGRGIPV